MPDVLLPPNAELVAVTWLRRELGATNVASSLPRDQSTWREAGFIQVQSVPTNADVDVPEHRGSLLQLDVWAHANADGATTTRPAWGLASTVTGLLLHALGNAQPFGAPLEWPDGEPWAPARVMSAYAMTEPSRVPDDPAGFARFTLDAVFDWAIQ